jgi:predicted DNA-binding transcriptional regulator YafY
MANIFQGESKEAQCVREWDRLLREGKWIDTDVFADIFDYKTISGQEELAYRKAIKKAKNDIRLALAERGFSLRESKSTEDNRKVLTAYPENNKDPLHDVRIMAIVEDAINYRRALQLVYAPSYHDKEEHIFHPQYLRIYNGRHYVYGVYDNVEENKGLPFVALPIDRIVTAVKTKDVPYLPGNPEEYERQMRDVMGASPNFRHPKVEDVILRTHDQKTHKLLLTKPLHHSIRELKPYTPEQYGELTIHVQISKELENWILHYGTGLEVISPIELRKQLAHVVHIINDYYKE